jgi:dihydrofolate reductase
MAANRVIGNQGDIPWKIPGEQRMFKQITLGHTVIMGRRTCASLGRPLPRRTNVCITRQADYVAPGCIVVHDLASALRACPADESEAFICGGGQLYEQALPLADRIYLTVIDAEIQGDTFFPEIPSSEFEVKESKHIQSTFAYDFYIYDRVRRSLTSKPLEPK